MTRRFLSFALVLLSTVPAGYAQQGDLPWQVSENEFFNLHYTAPDSPLLAVLTETLLCGIAENSTFFGMPYPKRFDVWCFPDRLALDRQWQRDWGDTTFQSSCWMVASGVAHRLDLLTPRVWDEQACEHRNPLAWVDSAAVAFRSPKAEAAFRRLLTHELTHVYHGQHCRIADFTGMDALGWWVEGLATYVSGQLDSSRFARVMELMHDGHVPAQLDQFWSGPNRYGLSGTVVAAIDERLGRAMLRRLLPLSSAEEVFDLLGMGEAGVLGIWREFLERRVNPK